MIHSSLRLPWPTASKKEQFWVALKHRAHLSALVLHQLPLPTARHQKGSRQPSHVMKERKSCSRELVCPKSESENLPRKSADNASVNNGNRLSSASGVRMRCLLDPRSGQKVSFDPLQHSLRRENFSPIAAACGLVCGRAKDCLVALTCCRWVFSCLTVRLGFQNIQGNVRCGGYVAEADLQFST